MLSSSLQPFLSFSDSLAISNRVTLPYANILRIGIRILRSAGFELYVLLKLVIIPPFLPPEKRNGFLPIIPASKFAVAPTGAPIVPPAGRVVPPGRPTVPDIPIEALIPPAVLEEGGTYLEID